MNTEFENMDDCIASFPADIQIILEKVRKTIRDASILNKKL
jgi:hypothetical protein